MGEDGGQLPITVNSGFNGMRRGGPPVPRWTRLVYARLTFDLAGVHVRPYMPWRRRLGFDLGWDDITGVERRHGGLHLDTESWEVLVLMSTWRVGPLREAFEVGGFEFSSDPKNPGVEHGRRRG